MTEFELLTLFGVAASLVIALWSLRVAMRAEKAQRKAAVAAALQERRNSAATHFQKYSDLLAEVRDATKAAKQEIKSSADEVLNRLYVLVDDVAEAKPPRYSRHLFHEMSEQIFEALAPELSFQHEEHVLRRYAGVRRKLRALSDACKRGDPHTGELGWIASIRVRLTLGPVEPSETPPESALLSSSAFFRIYGDLDSRLDKASGRRLLLESIEHVENFCETQRKLREVLDAGHHRLATALDRNSAEEFKLEESLEPWLKIQAEMRALCVLSCLGLNDIKHFREHDALDALPEFVYAGAVLYTVARVADHSRFSSDPFRG